MQNNVSASPGEEVDERRKEISSDSADQKDIMEEQELKPIDKIPDGPLTDRERLLIYEKGITFKTKGNFQHALYCLLACVRGLKEGSDFPHLPECLHNIAEIYSQLEDYENAISFAQAEKLYYETSLINIGTEAQHNQSEAGSKDVPGSSLSSVATDSVQACQLDNKDNGDSAEARSANEYEKLAHLCLKQKNAQLALEYCGKAVKLRQSIYGEEHVITKRTLDLFTVIYAEIGKEQYSEAMQKFTEAKQSEGEVLKDNTQPPKSAYPKKEITNKKEELPTEPDSRQSPVGEAQKEKKQNTASAEVANNDHRIGLSPSQAMLCFFLLTAIVTVCVTVLCCHVSGKDPVTTLKYIVTRVKFYYFYYMKRPSPGNKFF
ncbi:uncharacterized protein LOC141890482 isoform X1 [Acropora palmata]|uniref:uncharacterized protein LOC141890482 isoform X1 n=1 Tax=Acropora palmata TaxID=6131 RepID=UPI003DA0E871